MDIDLIELIEKNIIEVLIRFHTEAKEKKIIVMNMLDMGL